MNWVGWLVGIPLALVVVLICAGLVNESYENDKRRSGTLPRCGWTNAYGDPCFLEPGHSWMCRVRKKSGRDVGYYGINFDVVDGDPVPKRE